MTLFRTVRSAITGMGARLHSSQDADRPAATGDPMELPFSQRTAFNQQLSEQLDDSAGVLDDLDAKLLRLRTHVVNLRIQLAASQCATEASWDHIKSGISKEHRQLRDGVRDARPWARSPQKPVPGQS